MFRGDPKLQNWQNTGIVKSSTYRSFDESKCQFNRGLYDDFCLTVVHGVTQKISNEASYVIRKSFPHLWQFYFFSCHVYRQRKFLKVFLHSQAFQLNKSTIKFSLLSFVDINYYLGEDLIFNLPLGKRKTSKEENTFKIPSNNLGKIMCFIYSIKYDISLNIYVKQRLLMHVKLDLINIGITSSAFYQECTVCKKLGTLEEPKGGQCCWNIGKSSKRKER